ncbi:globin family protein [Tateyamaria sp.]|uniref:globin family protein n=1 Tax=Tateyamaria sp. TaxID=1929288 RepID=UPI00329EF0AB
MTPDQITLVQDSFAKVTPISEAAAAMFYTRLFEIAPEVKPLFKGDMTDQGAKLMATLGVVVKGLNDLGPIVPVAERLAIAHIDYGVKAEHYDFVGTALIDTLDQGLADDFTPETRAAWECAYATLSGVMIAAAYSKERA